MHVRCRESRSYGDFNACFDPRAKLIMCAANSVLTFHVSSPRPLNKSASSLRLCLFHCLSFSVLPHGFERRRTCSYCYMCAPFLSFSSHLRIPFFSPSSGSFLFFFFFFFFISIFLYSYIYAHLFYRPQLYSSTSFLGRDYLLVCFSFHSS